MIAVSNQEIGAVAEQCLVYSAKWIASVPFRTLNWRYCPESSASEWDDRASLKHLQAN